MSLIDDYQLLEIPTNASEQEAKSAFRRLARLYHPDKNPDKDTTEHFQRLQAAYQNVLDAIKQGIQVNDWKPYHFNQANAQSSTANSRYRHFSTATDKEQEAFIKERQRAYEEMKRNSMQQEKARNEAIKAARNTLNEKRVKAIYEEAFKASKNFTSQGYTEPSKNTHQQDIPSYQSFVDDVGRSENGRKTSYPIRLYAAKAAFRSATYIACFAAGIYATLYWQGMQQNEPQENLEMPYISGLYPQFRIGTNYTLVNTSLYAEPDLSTSKLLSIPTLSNVQSIKLQGDWLTVRYQGINGWLQAKDVGFGSAQNAVESGCIGQPGPAPRHGQLIGKADGKSRLRILNQLPLPSILRFESFDGQAPFSIYLNANQAYAANYIPRGRYRLVLETGSLYHHACNQFLFNDTTKVILENVDFAGTEQSLTLKP